MEESGFGLKGRIMNRRLVTAVGASLLLVAGMLPAAASAASPTRKFEHLDVSKIDPQLGPALLANRPVTVVVQLKGAPASGRAGLTREQKVAEAKKLKAAQDGLDAGIARAGGKVLAKYQYAYNGIKVRLGGRSIAALSALPGVVAVRGVHKYELDNTQSVPFIGAPNVWDGGQTGASQTIAVIDTGIDYTHANFGGPGTVAAFNANNPTVVEVGTFPTAKVIAGHDFAGNGYDAGGEFGSPTPTPDPDPLDCNGHGSHVAGTAAGNGVTTSGAYAGPYNSTSTYSSNTFKVGPGVAPQAKLVALKVFGCEGSTDLTVDALEWVGAYNEVLGADDIDVVNMSLGSSFGHDQDPSAVATNVLVASGVVVVASAGNSGAGAYITGAPGVATGAISVAAEDTLATFPGAIIDFTSAAFADITHANNQNAFPRLPVSGTLKVIYSAAGVVSLGCTAADYGTLAARTVVAIQRGVCAFVDKGAAAQAAGAVGIIDINRDDLPPGELPTFIGYNPEIFDIPMIGVGNGSKAAIIAADGQGVILQPGGVVANPTFKQPASFTSGGPRNGDSAAKPDVTAPGVSIVSTLSGSGNNGTTLSGTSMASPHAAGVAALVRAAHPGWTPVQVKAAIMNTATIDPSVTDPTLFSTRVTGAGLVQPRKATDTVALATTGSFTASLSFGYDPLAAAYSEALTVTIQNNSGSPITYDLTSDSEVVSVPATVVVPAGTSVPFQATAARSAAQVAALPTTSVLLGGQPWGGVNTFEGAIVATPRSSGAGIYSLRIPFLGVPRGLSSITAGTRSAYTVSGGIARATVPLRNTTGIHSGFADVYAWGLSDPQDVPAGPYSSMDIRAVGVQSIPAEFLTGVPNANDRGLVFAINTHGRWSTAAENEFDIAIFGANKKKPDFFVVGVDIGAVTTGSFNGAVASIIFDAAGNMVDAWVADAPSNGSTILLPLLASNIGQTGNNQRFTYSATAFSLQDDTLVDAVAGQAAFSVKKPAVSTGQFIFLAPGASANLRVTVDKGKLAVTPTRGWMVVTLDDANGAAQADLVPIGRP